MAKIMRKLFISLYFKVIYKMAFYIQDEILLKFLFFIFLGKKLNLKNPVSFNEKLQWIKINYRLPIFTTMVDKFLVKEYVTNIIGKEYIIPTLEHWENVDHINFDNLPNKFVLKCNHNSGYGMYICKDKSALSEKNIRQIKRKLRKGMVQNYYNIGREWPYKNVKRCVIAEKFLETEEDDLPDYKFHCFNGKVKMVLVCKNRFSKSGMTEDFFDEKWNHLPIQRKTHCNAEKKIDRPEKLDEMIGLAEKLANNLPFLRVDFYLIKDKIYFGELTFFPASGFEKFIPEQWDYTMGSWITLS